MIRQFLLVIIFLCLIACKDNKAIKVYFFLDTDCPICQKYEGTFKHLIKKYDKNNIQFLFVFSELESEDDINQFCTYNQISKKNILIDKNKIHQKKLNATTTPQAIITFNDKIKYSGLINDRFITIGSERPPKINYVEKALLNILQNEDVEIPITQPVGCVME